MYFACVFSVRWSNVSVKYLSQYLHAYNKELVHGWFLFTILIFYSLLMIPKLTCSMHSLVLINVNRA
jgi:hypothetical protein